MAHRPPDALRQDVSGARCNLFFSPDEIQGAYLLTSTNQPVDRTPTLNDVLRLVARRMAPADESIGTDA
jgi:hypothetical protein